MKRNVAIASLFLLVSFTFSACAPAVLDVQTSDEPSISTEIPADAPTGTPAVPNIQTSDEPSIPTEIPADAPTGTPEFLNDIGKTLGELKSEHPEGEFIVNLDAYPDSASICFGESEAEYVYYFFGTQSGDAKKTMDTYEDQLQCAGIITTASVLFPGMEDNMSFEDFFSWIGVKDYEYLGEDAFAAEGCLRFTYRNMAVWVNTNEITAGGGWNVTGAEIVTRTAPVAIVFQEILNSNQHLADSVMFD